MIVYERFEYPDTRYPTMIDINTNTYNTKFFNIDIYQLTLEYVKDWLHARMMHDPKMVVFIINGCMMFTNTSLRIKSLHIIILRDRKK